MPRLKKTVCRVRKYPNGERINKTLYATPDRERSRPNFANPSSDSDSEQTVGSDSATLIRTQTCEMFPRSPVASHLARTMMGLWISHHLMGVVVVVVEKPRQLSKTAFVFPVSWAPPPLRYPLTVLRFFGHRGKTAVRSTAVFCILFHASFPHPS